MHSSAADDIVGNNLNPNMYVSWIWYLLAPPGVLVFMFISDLEQSYRDFFFVVKIYVFLASKFGLKFQSV